MVKAASERARVVAEEQAKEKVESEKRKREAFASASADSSPSSPADALAASLLGEEGRPLGPVSGASSTDDSIVTLLEARQKNAGTDQAGGTNP